MSLEKSIKNGRERRKTMTHGEHGSSSWAQDNRHYRNIKKKQAIKKAEEEYLKGY